MIKMPLCGIKEILHGEKFIFFHKKNLLLVLMTN